MGWFAEGGRFVLYCIHAERNGMERDRMQWSRVEWMFVCLSVLWTLDFGLFSCSSERERWKGGEGEREGEREGEGERGRGGGFRLMIEGNERMGVVVLLLIVGCGEVRWRLGWVGLGLGNE